MEEELSISATSKQHRTASLYKVINRHNLDYKIGAVISAVKGKNLANIIPKHIEYLYIPAIDHESFDISQYFDTSY